MHIFFNKSGPLIQVKLFPGCKLEYEFKQHKKRTSEKDFVTAVEFCSEYPYGKAVALFDLKSGILTVCNHER